METILLLYGKLSLGMVIYDMNFPTTCLTGFYIYTWNTLYRNSTNFPYTDQEQVNNSRKFMKLSILIQRKLFNVFLHNIRSKYSFISQLQVLLCLIIIILLK